MRYRIIEITKGKDRHYLLQEKRWWWKWKDSKYYFIIQEDDITNNILVGDGKKWTESRPLKVIKNLLQYGWKTKKYRGYWIYPISVFNKNLFFQDCRFTFSQERDIINLGISWPTLESIKEEIDKLFPVLEKTIIRVID